MFFPMWFQKTIGDWTIDGGGGYWINQGGGDKNFGSLVCCSSER